MKWTFKFGEEEHVAHFEPIFKNGKMIFETNGLLMDRILRFICNSKTLVIDGMKILLQYDIEPVIVSDENSADIRYKIRHNDTFIEEIGEKLASQDLVILVKERAIEDFQVKSQIYDINQEDFLILKIIKANRTCSFFYSSPQSSLSKLRNILDKETYPQQDRSYIKHIYYKPSPESSDRIPVELDTENKKIFKLDSKNNRTNECIPFKSFMEFVFSIEYQNEIFTGSENKIPIRKSFQKKLLVPGQRQRDIIIHNLSSLWSIFVKSGAYAPFTSINQSSGSGKTRVLIECGQYLPIVYGAYRQNASVSGYPPCSPWFKRLAEYINVVPGGGVKTINEANHGPLKEIRVGRALIFLASVLNAYDQLFESLKSSNSGKSDFELIKKISRSMSLENGQSRFNSFVDPSPFESKTLAELNECISSICAKYTAISMEEFKNSSNSFLQSSSQSFPFIIILDECADLLNLDPDTYFSIRRATHHLHQNIRLMCVAVGTNTDVTVMHTQVKTDSLRDPLKSSLLPPIILTCDWNIFMDDMIDELIEFPLNQKSVLSNSMLRLLRSFGRPLWSSLAAPIQTAIDKIKNGSKDPYEPSMAVLSIRAGFDVSVDLILSENLVRSHMATLLSVNYPNDAMTIAYPSEPILALGARLITSFGHCTYQEVFDSLRKFALNRPIDKGEINETVLNLILLFGVDVSLNVSNSQPVPNHYGGEDSLIQKFLNSKTSFLLQNVDDVHISSDEDEDKGEEDIETERGEKEKIEEKELEKEIENIAAVPGIKRKDSAAPDSPPKKSGKITQEDEDENEKGFVENYSPNTVKADGPVMKIEGATAKKNIDVPSKIYFDTDAYLITTVENYLISLFGQDAFSSIKPSVPKKALKGLVNASHVMRFDAKFPFERAYGKDRAGKVHNGPEFFALDTAILRYCFLHQAMIKFPPNYPGLDSAIPILIPRSENSDEEDIFSYIGVQFKCSYVNPVEITKSMMAHVHFTPCPHHGTAACDKNCKMRTSEKDLEIIYGNQLSLYLNTTQRSQKKRNPLVFTDTFSSSNGNHKNVCIIAKNLDAFSSARFMSPALAETIDNIIHYDRKEYACAEEYSNSSVSDALISMQPYVYPQANKFIRRSRQQSKLDDLIKDSDSISLTFLNFMASIRKYKWNRN